MIKINDNLCALVVPGDAAEYSISMLSKFPVCLDKPKLNVQVRSDVYSFELPEGKWEIAAIATYDNKVLEKVRFGILNKDVFLEICSLLSENPQFWVNPDEEPYTPSLTWKPEQHLEQREYEKWEENEYRKLKLDPVVLIIKKLD